MSIRKTIVGLCCLGAVVLGSTAGSFLENPISARSMAMGNVGAALQDGSGIYINPALIKTLDGQHNYQIMQGQFLTDVNYFAFNYAQPTTPLLGLGFGFSFLNNGIEGLEATTYDLETGTAEYTGDTFGYTGRAYVLTTGQKLFQDLYWGANIKFIQENLYEQNSSGAGVDIGLLWQKSKWQIGISALNIVQPEMTWNEGWVETLNTRIIFGLAYKILQHSTVYTDIEQNGERPVYYSLGTELNLFNSVALRGGWNPDQISAGTGLHWKGFGIDYAYIMSSDQAVGASHFISLVYILGNNKDLDRLAEEERNRQQMRAAIEAEKQRKELEVFDDWTKAFEPPAAAATTKQEKAPEPVVDDWMSVFGTPANTAPVVETKPAPAPAPAPVPIVTAVPENVDSIPTRNRETFTFPVHDYQITLMASRYYYQNNRLQVSIYMDNTGNQPLDIKATFKIVDSHDRLVHEETIEQALGVDSTEVARINYTKPLPDGVYSLEFSSSSTGGVVNYKKETFIKNSNQ